MWRGLFLLLLVAGLFAAWRWRGAPRARWQPVAPGIEMMTFSVAAPHTWDGRSKVVALRTRPERVHVVRGSTLDAPGWARRTAARAALNGGYFDEKGNSLGLRVCDGRRFGRLHPANWGVFYIHKNRVGSMRAGILHTRDFTREYSSLRRIAQAVQCGPRLVVKGRVTDLKPQTARRSGIGITRDGRVVLAVADDVLSFSSWANVWARRDLLDCPDALNLDGGGSTQLYLKTKSRTVSVPGVWPVPDAIVVR